ncbi:MAG: Hsp20/alpha crystallin family protein [Pirellulaceae bacterium]|nr:Hsp20/alpha crystallin family protein [Planctomycetales bacterium]
MTTAATTTNSTTTTTTTTNPSTDAATSNPRQDAMTFVPRFDSWETDEAYVLSGDLPGATTDDLDIRYEDGQLIIDAVVLPRYAGKRLLLAEYDVGSFHRVFTVGEGIDAGGIAADLHGGVLTIHLPKSKQILPRKIEIKSA